MASAIAARDLYEQINAGAVREILDLRGRADATIAPIAGRRPVSVRNVPVYDVMDDLDAAAAQISDDAIVVCGQGNGSATVVEELAARGRRTRSLAGGTDAWARLLVPVEMPDGPEAVRAWQVQRPAKGCLSYLVGIPGESCIVVDPSRNLDPYVELAADHGMSVAHIIETHLHADHVSGGPLLAERVGAVYHVPPEDIGGSSPYVGSALAEGDELDLGVANGATVRVMSLHLPGHTPGSIALLVGERLALVGDTVFVRGLGRPDLTGHADELARALFRSLHDRLAHRDPQTYLAPAHWSSPEEFDDRGLVRTTLADAFDSDLLRDKPMEEFVADVVGSLPDAPPEYDTIRQVNAGVRSLPASALDLLDVGMNRCAG